MEIPSHGLNPKSSSPLKRGKTVSVPSSPIDLKTINPPHPLNLSPTVHNLENARIIQRNLVYIINLPLSVSEESVLSSPLYFGKYGKISKVHINKGLHSSPDPTFGAYITYSNEEEAIVCIRACHEVILDSKKLSVTFGTTKYCSSFLKNSKCPKPECVFLHSLASMADTIFREDILSTKHIQTQDSVFDKIRVNVFPPQPPSRLPEARIVRERAISEQVNGNKMVLEKRARIFSRDLRQNSKFWFIQECGEAGTVELPKAIEKLRLFAVPCKDSAVVPASDIEEIMSPSSPDKWAADVLDVSPCFDLQSTVIVSQKQK